MQVRLCLNSLLSGPYSLRSRLSRELLELQAPKLLDVIFADFLRRVQLTLRLRLSDNQILRRQ